MSREREYIEPDVKKVKIEGDEDIVFKDENNCLVRYAIKKEEVKNEVKDEVKDENNCLVRYAIKKEEVKNEVKEKVKDEVKDEFKDKIKDEIKDEPQEQANKRNSVQVQGSNRLEGDGHGKTTQKEEGRIKEDSPVQSILKRSLELRDLEMSRSMKSNRHNEWPLDRKIYIGDLDNYCSRYELEDAFSPFGSVKNVWIAKSPKGSNYTTFTFAFILMNDPRDAVEAVKKLHGTRICGGRVKVKHCKKGGEKKGRGDWSRGVR